MKLSCIVEMYNATVTLLIISSILIFTEGGNQDSSARLCDLVMNHRSSDPSQSMGAVDGLGEALLIQKGLAWESRASVVAPATSPPESLWLDQRTVGFHPGTPIIHSSTDSRLSPTFH